MNRIKILRKAAGLSQKQLSDELNISDSTLSYWERGTVDPGISNLVVLSRRFNVTIDYLLGVEKDITQTIKHENASPFNGIHAITIEDLPALSENGRRQVVNFARFLAEQERKEAAEKIAPEQGNTKI